MAMHRARALPCHVFAIDKICIATPATRPTPGEYQSVNTLLLPLHCFKEIKITKNNCSKRTCIVQFVTNYDNLSKNFTISRINLPNKNNFFRNQTFSFLARYMRIRRCRRDIIASKFLVGTAVKIGAPATVQTPGGVLMIKKALLALAISGAMTTTQAATVTQDFADVSTLAAAGWVFTNASTPVGVVPNWFQGNVTSEFGGFDAHSGAATSYISANYNNTADGGTISNWLITPEFSALYGATISFWLRGAGDGFLDQIAYGFSSGSAAITSFVLDQTVTAPTGTWSQYTASIGPTTGTARFAIEYLGAYATANAVGVDTMTFDIAEATADVPEPASLAILAAGLIGMGATRRRKNKQA
jgi:hypothetical protein